MSGPGLSTMEYLSRSTTTPTKSRAPSEDVYQPAHQRNLIRVLAVHLKIWDGHADLRFRGAHLSRDMTKPTKWLRKAKTQINLDIRPVWSESPLCAQWVAKGPSFLHADSEDFDQTGRMPRLIWVFAGRTHSFVGFVMSRLICDFACFVVLRFVSIHCWQ